MQDLGGIRPADGVSQHVPRPAEVVVRLLETELPYVPRHSRLRDDAARGCKRVEQLELGADPLPRDEALDQPLSLRLPQLHNFSIRMQVWPGYGLVELNVNASEAPLDRALRGLGRARDDRVAPHCHADLAYAHGRGSTDKEMTADQTVERAAKKLQQLANQFAGEGGFKSKLAQPLAEDADLLRKMKPSLIKARAKGEAPMNQKPGGRAAAPSSPQIGGSRRNAKEKSRGPNPWIVVGAALVAGVVVAKWIDWRGHAHPRN